MSSYTVPCVETPLLTTTMEKFNLSIANINYGGSFSNILEYYSRDLDSYDNFTNAEIEFNSMTYKSFLDAIPEDNKYRFSPVTQSLSVSDIKLPIVQLVKDGKINWGADNQTGYRPNAIKESGTVSRPFSVKEVINWYFTTAFKYDAAFQKEATSHLDGQFDLVKIGLMVYDVLCNMIYESHNLHEVRPEMRRETDEEEKIYQFEKFKTIIQPLLSNDIVTVQESIDFNTLYTSSWCFKTYVIPSGKTFISGTPDSNISILVDSEVAKNTTLLSTPTIYTHKYLKKTSCFSINIRGKHILLVVLHMKNPKGEAGDVASDLKSLIELIKSESKVAYDMVITSGDTNLESKNGYTPAEFVTSIGLNKVGNNLETTSKKRTWAHTQVTKANMESFEEKDIIGYSSNLVEKNHMLHVIVSSSGTNNIYPTLELVYLPTTEWPSDHKGLSAILEEN